MNKSLLAIIFSFFLLKTVYAQSPVEVTDQTFKLGARAEKEFYYSFAEGDKIVVNFQEQDNKELKVVEITEMPASSRLAEYKSSRLINRRLNVNRNGIYRFSFVNVALSGRICKLNIKRIPANLGSSNFNTSVYKELRNDSLYFSTSQTYLEKSDTTALSLVNMVAKVAGRASFDKNSNQTIVDFTLPSGTVSWAYYIGAGTEGMKAEADARSKFINTSASVLSRFEGYGTMAALALYSINAYDKAQGGENIKYWFLPNWDNVQKFKARTKYAHYKQGDVVNDAVQMKSPLSGKVFLALENDNMVQSVDVLVKVTAIQVNQKWSNRMVTTLVMKDPAR